MYNKYTNEVVESQSEFLGRAMCIVFITHVGAVNKVMEESSIGMNSIIISRSVKQSERETLRPSDLFLNRMAQEHFSSVSLQLKQEM